MKTFLQKHLLLLIVGLLAVNTLVVTSSLYSSAKAANAASPMLTSTPIYRSVKLFVNQTISPGQTLNSNYIRVQGYRKVAFFANCSPGSSIFFISGGQSLDGVNDYSDRTPGYNGAYLDGCNGPEQASAEVTSPYFRLVAQYNVDPSSPPITFNATVYLMPF